MDSSIGGLPPHQVCTPAKLVAHGKYVTHSPPVLCLLPPPPHTHLDHGVVRHSGRVGRVLVNQVRVLGPASPPKVLDLRCMAGAMIVFGIKVGEAA